IFFSSRRRHTRCYRDWSSDVCSSDLASYNAVLSSNLINSFRYGFIRQGVDNIGLKNQHFVHFRGLDNPQGFTTATQSHVPVNNRSEERRVGKEWRTSKTTKH